MNSKGIFSTISGFFLIVVIVFAAIGLIGFYTGLVELDAQSRQEQRVYDKAANFKDNLLICHGQSALDETMLQNQNETGPCSIPADIKGFSLDYRDSARCNGTVQYGDTEDPNLQRISYKLSVLQEDEVTSCVGTLQVYV